MLERLEAPTYPLVVDVGQNSSHQLNEEDQQQQEEVLRNQEAGERQAALKVHTWNTIHHHPFSSKTTNTRNKKVKELKPNSKRKHISRNSNMLKKESEEVKNVFKPSPFACLTITLLQLNSDNITKLNNHILQIPRHHRYYAHALY